MTIVYKEFPTDMTSKSNPVDADILLIADSEDNNEMKKITIGSITADIGDGLIVDASASSTTTYSSDKINTLNSAQDSTITSNYNTLNTNKLNKTAQLRTGNGAWKVTYNNGSGDETEVTLGSAGQALLSNGATSAPTFGTPTADINGQTEDTTGDMDADFVLAYDASATANRKQKINVYRASAGDITTGTTTTKFPSVAQMVTLLAHTNGTTTKDSADASATQNIAHWLGRIPKNARIKAFFPSIGLGGTLESETVYNGTTQSSFSVYAVASGSGTITSNTNFRINGNYSGSDINYQTWVVTFDATNIIITWTKTGSPTWTYTLLWDAE